MVFNIELSTAITTFIVTFFLGVAIGIILICLTQVKNIRLKGRHHLGKGTEYDRKAFVPDDAYRKRSS